MEYIYLDNNATTRVDPQVLERMLPYLTEEFANPSSVHTPGQRVRVAVEEARRECAALIGAKAAELVFTGSGTESDNLAIFGVLSAGAGKRRHIVTSSVEHAAVRLVVDHLEAEGWPVTRLPVDTAGRVSTGDLEAALRPDTALVSIQHANNEIGTIQDIPRLAEVARRTGALFHTDAVQSAGKIPMDVSELGVDLLTFSSHKIHGPKGIGALWIRSGILLAPLVHGGHQERGRRSGTENVPGIIGFGAACALAREFLPRFRTCVRPMRDAFERAIFQHVPGAVVHARDVERIDNVSNISFPGAEQEAVVISLDLRGVAASAGSACSSGSTEPSPVLKAIGCPPEILHSAVRFSFARDNRPEDAFRGATAVAEVVAQIRASMNLLG
jgi:cysteine desulfurase